MTDRRPDRVDDPLPARLSDWFDGEVRQAAADLRLAPLGSGRARGRAHARAPFAPLAAVVLVAIVVVAGLTRLPGVTPGTEPTGSTGATRPGVPSATSGATSPGVTGFPALVVDNRYPDGIPSSLGGRYVARPATIDREPANEQAFLLGGWSFDFSAIAYSCPIQIGTPPPFGPRCGTPFLAENPLMDENPRVMLDGTAPGPGPVVLQVHRYDARSAGCDADQRAACEAMAVIEKVVWRGDDVTAAAPRTATDTFMRLIQADANLPQARITAMPKPGTITPPAHFPAFAGCYPPLPNLAWSIGGTSLLQVLVFPTVAAREAVDQDFTAGGFRGTSPEGGPCFTATDAAASHEWVAVENVMVAVEVDAHGPTPSQARLVEDVRSALTRP